MPGANLDLRGAGGLWGGIVDTSALAPVAGPVREMTNLLVSRDGTALRPAPGLRVSGRPFHGQAMTVLAKTVGASATTLRVDVTADRNANAFFASSFHVWIPADEAIYLATRVDADEFTIPTTTSSVAVNDLLLVGRKHRVHDMATCDGRAALAIETACWASVSTELRNVATTVCSRLLSITDPPGPGIPDETDADFVLWPSPTMAPLNQSEPGHNDSRIATMRHREIERRMQCEPINGRLAIAVPGMGCLLEANIRRAREWLPRDTDTATYAPSPRWTRMLGIPRGHMPYAGLEASIGGALDDGWYAAAVAYYDPYQDDVGLLSQVQVVQATAGANLNKLTVYATYPRGSAYEAVGLQTIIYLAGPFTAEADAHAATLEAFYPIGPLRTSLDFGALNISYTATCFGGAITADFATLSTIRPRRTGVIEVPPSGASWLRAARARLFFGGERPLFWEFSAWPYQKTVLGVTQYYLALPEEWNLNTPVEGPLAWGKLPPALAGRTVAQLGPQIAAIGMVLSTHNAVVGTISGGVPNGAVGPGTIRIDFDGGTTVTPNDAALKDYRVFARQQGVRFCEEDNPGVAPATNELPIDSLSDTITTGAARIGDMLLAFTRHQTMLLSWAAQPTAAAALTLSNRFGCASPHSIVEWAGGAAWLSARGPCISNGQGVRWIGERLEAAWSQFLVDSEGMVVCAGAVADEESKTIFWALRRDTGGDWESATTDQLKALVPCDTLLCWNWGTEAFSLSEAPSESIESLKAMLYDDGIWRPTIASARTDDADALYSPLWAMTGTTQRAAAVAEFETSEWRDPSTSQFVAADIDDVAVPDDPAFIRSSDGKTLRWHGQIESATSTYATLTDADEKGWQPGDVLVVNGPRHATMTTHRLRLFGGSEMATFRGVTIEADVEADHAYAVCSVEADDDGDAVQLPPARVENGYTELTGHAAGDHIAVTLTFVADGDYRIKSIILHGEGFDAGA